MDTPPTEADAIIRQHYREMAAKRMTHTRTCVICGTEMQGVMARRMYCSEACKSKGQRAHLAERLRALESRAAVTSNGAEAEVRES